VGVIVCRPRQGTRGRGHESGDRPAEIPANWLAEGVTVEQVVTALRPLLGKPAEIVLRTDGEPADRAALDRALG
jgi:hypothetical protein